MDNTNENTFFISYLLKINGINRLDIAIVIENELTNRPA